MRPLRGVVLSEGAAGGRTRHWVRKIQGESGRSVGRDHPSCTSTDWAHFKSPAQTEMQLEPAFSASARQLRTRDRASVEPKSSSIFEKGVDRLRTKKAVFLTSDTVLET